MASNVYKFIKGQTKEGLNFTLLDKNTGNAVDITGATIVLTAFQPKSREKLFDGNCILDVPASGTFYYTFIAADLNDVGTFEGEVEITFSDSSIGKIQDFYLKVEDQAPT
jgi:hypothetical protein